MPRIKKLHSQSYLERLQFDPKLLGSVVAKYIGNIRIVFLLALGILLLGTFSYLNLPKRLNPEVKIPIISVSTVLPGAGPEDVESLVTIPLENQLRSLKGLDTMTSVSRENVSFISMQFLSSVNRDDAKKDVQSIVSGFTNLPENAGRPSVTALDFEDQPVWVFTITNGDIRSLMSFSDALKKRITDLSKVDRVITSGFEDQEVVISVKPEKIQELGINPLTLAQSIRTGIASYPAGSVNSGTNSFALTITPSITTIDDIRRIRITLQGHTVTLGDIASIEERSKTDQQRSYVASANQTAQRSVTFYVYKTTSSNIDEAGQQVKTEVNKALEEYHQQFKLTTLINTSDEITKQFNDLLGEFRTTIILVFACLLLFLGLRQAIISSFTVPLTFFSAFFFMRLLGMSINFLSLFAFLLALGLLVDDTIVTVSAMTTYYKTKKFTPLETGLLVWRDTIVPIWSTTITTIWSFIPLLLSTGIIGEFIKPIPIVVTVTMISSTAIAVLITLPIMIVILKPNVPKRVALLLKLLLLLLSLAALVVFFVNTPLLPIIVVLYILLFVVTLRVRTQLTQRAIEFVHKQSILHKTTSLIQKYSDHGIIHIDGFAAAYHRLILRILNSPSARKKVIIAIVVYAIFSFALLPMGFVTNEFFPKSDQNEFFVNLELPSGATIQKTEQESLKILEELRKTQFSDFVVDEVGKTQSMSTALSNTSNDALFSIHLIPKENRNVTSVTLAQQIRDRFKDYTTGTISVVEASGGPPAGADLQIKLLGKDLGLLDQYADKIEEYLKKQPGVTNVAKSVTPGTSRLVFVPDQDKVSTAGLTIDSLGLWLRTYGSGFPLTSINFDKSRPDKEDITFKMDVSKIDPEGISAVTVTNQQGVSYPLSALGRVTATSNPNTITRENSNRTLSVTATVTKGFSITQKNTELEKFADSLQLPSGYSWKTGGVNEENTKSVNSILQAMVIAFLLILITMVIQFQSFRQAIIVLIVIPLAVSSVFLIFALTGTPLSFPALIGVLSLFGIVVTNSMFIVDKINLNKKQGMKLKEAIADAGASRLEPIILTKLCTVLGLLPITLKEPLWQGLGGAIISGLLISSTIMLLFIPTLYYMWFKDEDEKSPAVATAQAGR